MCFMPVDQALDMQVCQWLGGFQGGHKQPQIKYRAAQGVHEVGQGDHSREQVCCSVTCRSRMSNLCSAVLASNLELAAHDGT